MENLEHFNKIRSTPQENRKRHHNSGRLSPRALFGNLISKKPFKEEDMKSRDLINSKSTASWKPPLKIDLNESNSTCSTYYNDNIRQKFNSSQQNLRDSTPLQEHSLNKEGESNFFNPKGNIYFSEQAKSKDEEESDAESFTGNSEETVLYESYSKQKQLNFQESLLDHGASSDNSSNDGNVDICLKNQESDTNYEYGKIIGSDVTQKHEDPKSFDVNKEFPIRNIHNYNSINYSPNEKSFDEPIFDLIHTQYEETDMMFKKNLGKTSENDRSDDSSINQLELNKQLKILATESNNVKSNIPPQNSFEEDINKENNVFSEIKSAENLIDHSFDLAVTNSQFLQLEKQVLNDSNNRDIKESHNISLNNNTEIIKRCSTSMIVQTEWQKNILKSIIKDINELNKTVLNATEMIKSARRGNASSK